MNVTVARGCVWCGVAFVVLFGIGFLVAGFLPPPAPSATAAEIADRFSRDADRIRAGVQLAWAAGMLFVPFVAVISHLMRRAEGEFSPLATVQFGAGLGASLLFVLPLLQLQAAAFRPGRPAEVVQAIQDMAWMPFVGSWAVPATQSVAVAVLVFTDRGPAMVFPRWVGYFNLWVAATYLPAIAMPFFQTGPLSWRGVLPFWLGAVAFFGWVVVMAVVSLRALARQRPRS
jgi:hypothetical protein